MLITKPATQRLGDHLALVEAARKHGVFVFVEHHKRFDPAYSDARAKAKTLGDFNYFYSYMSQPKSQLETFKAWAGRDSDISYYLNSHHIDVCESMVPEYKPVRVTATASQGTAATLGCVPETEDTITLLVEWRRRDNPAKIATGVYTASWTAPQNAGVHSNQYFHCMLFHSLAVFYKQISSNTLEQIWLPTARSVLTRLSVAMKLPVMSKVSFTSTRKNPIPKIMSHHGSMLIPI